MAKRKLLVGANLTLLGTVGYYASYAWVLYHAIYGGFTIGDLAALTGAIAGASAGVQSVFSSFSSIANEGLRSRIGLQILASNGRHAQIFELQAANYR